MPRPKQRTPELRARLLEVAITTLGEEGIGGFTTRRVAGRADTSASALYELFTDRAGLIRAVFFEGFRQLGNELAALPATDDPIADVQALVPVFRRFCLENPRLAEVMFSKPFADFEPGPDELAAGASVRDMFIARCRRCVEAGLLTGDPSDIAHALLALAHGFTVQEAGRWIGTSESAIERRWTVGVSSLIEGFR